MNATATLVDVDGHKLTFELSGADEIEPIASGTHTRFLVDKTKFTRKAQEKRRYTA